MAACAFGAAAAQPRVPGAPQAIAAPHYGDTLFHFYQDHTFTALTGLMVSQHFGRIAPHDDEAEVLRGGMLLAYGLHDEAATVFARLIENNTTPTVRNRAWYFLAQARHQRGLNTLAEAALARVDTPLPGPLEDEHQLLRAQLLMARDDYAGAAAVLEALQANPQAAPHAGLYARYNLGVALVKTGDVEKGRALLDAVGQTPAPNEELRSLRDRANVALGFATLATQQPREARLALQRVRLNGPSSNKALLGFGWAAAELKDPQLALAPWTELAGRGSAGGADASVLEARIALPYAMAELRAYGSALKGYGQAAEGFEKEQQALTESIAAIRAGTLVQGLLADNSDGAAAGLGAASGLRVLPDMPHAAHLAPLLAGHAFQAAFKNLRDLKFLDTNLAQWQDSLGVYTDMLENRRRAYAEKLPAVRASTGAADIAALVQRRDALAAELARVQAENDATAYADERERGLLQRLARGRATAASPGQAEVELPAETTERLRRAAGALTWQLAQAFPARDWEATKALRAGSAGLARAREQDAALARAQQEEPARHAAFAERITQLGQRVQALRPGITQAAVAVQAQLQDIAVAELEAQQERLAVYAAQARLAIAQIHDQAQFAQRPNAAGAAR
ncbi:MAG: tetratricopeptide repeat protein [Rubrivivax sp.]|nr:tetratricopeptide repeat protein [Rubrivivax sp.]